MNRIDRNNRINFFFIVVCLDLSRSCYAFLKNNIPKRITLPRKKILSLYLFLPDKALNRFYSQTKCGHNLFSSGWNDSTCSPSNRFFSGESCRQNKLAGGHIYGGGFYRKSFFPSCQASPEDLLTNIKVNGVALFSGGNSISALRGCKWGSSITARMVCIMMAGTRAACLTLIRGIEGHQD